MSDTAHVLEITKPSEKKIEANRRNAKLSTGPRTEAGKNRSRYNAIKHGIFSRDMLQSWGLGKEEAKEFDDLLTALLEDRKPVGVLEEVLVQRIALCFWRLRRAVQYEAGTVKLRYVDAQRALQFTRGIGFRNGVSDSVGSSSAPSQRRGH